VRGIPVSSAALVLLVDDDPGFRRFARMALEDEGFDVLEIEDGRAAAEYLAEAAQGGVPIPDVILLDCLMPGLSGLGVLSLVRRFRSRMPPMILVTGFADKSVDLLAVRLGAVRVLHKPADADAIRSLVVEAAQGRF
jgi:CheY-like chemotaxis protein